jgi:hypothetical protein
MMEASYDGDRMGGHPAQLLHKGFAALHEGVRDARERHLSAALRHRLAPQSLRQRLLRNRASDTAKSSRIFCCMNERDKKI